MVALQLRRVRQRRRAHRGRRSHPWLGEPLPGFTDDLPDDPLAARPHAVARRLRTPRAAGLPPLTGGLVGYLATTSSGGWSGCQHTAADDLGMPELAMSLVTDLAVLDHHDATVLLSANAFSRTREAYDDAVARLDAMAADLTQAAPPGWPPW